MIRKLGHLCLVTDQLDKQLAFYTEKLGLNVQFVFRNKDDEVFGYYLAVGDTTFIEIFDRVGKHKQWGGNSHIEPLKGGNQMNHLCFEVTALRDLRETLIARGVKVTEVKSGLDNSLQAWTGDPDGNAVELMEYTHRSKQLQPPQD